MVFSTFRTVEELYIEPRQGNAREQKEIIEDLSFFVDSSIHSDSLI